MLLALLVAKNFRVFKARLAALACVSCLLYAATLPCVGHAMSSTPEQSEEIPLLRRETTLVAERTISSLVKALAPYSQGLDTGVPFPYIQLQEDSLGTTNSLSPARSTAFASDGVVSMFGTFNGFQDITTCSGRGIYAGPDCSDVSVSGFFDNIVTKSGSPAELTGQW